MTTKLDAAVMVRWTGGERVFPPTGDVRIGRSRDCDVVIDRPGISRVHARLEPGPQGWVYVDEASSQGSYVGGQAVHRHAISVPVTVRLGSSDDGDDIDLSPAVANDRHALMSVVSSGAGRDEHPTHVVSPLPPPSAMNVGSLGDETVVGGDALHLQFAGESYALRPGREWTIGRASTADIRCQNPTVSRLHARISHDGSQWVLHDAGSSSGITIDGRRRPRVVLAGSMALWIGPADTGERLVVSAGGRRRVPVLGRLTRLGRGSLVAHIVGLAALLVAGYVYLGGEHNTASANDHLQGLERATVLIEAGERLGSGTVITADGLILTNAHVVAPNALGQGLLYDTIGPKLPPAPDRIIVSVANDTSHTVEPTYVAAVVAVDGYLDLAVLRPIETLGGTLINPGQDLHLPAAPIGDSTALAQGDSVDVLGFPGVADTRVVTVTHGTVASFQPDRRLQDNRAFINTDAPLARGNSGGMAADREGRLVAVPTLRITDQGDQISVLRPVHLAAALIDAARKRTPYKSPFVKEVGATKLSFATFAAPTQPPGFQVGCSTAVQAAPAAGDRAIALGFGYEGMPPDHQDVMVQVTRDGTTVGQVDNADQYPLAFGEKGCAVATAPLDAPLTAGNYTITIYLGGNLTPLAALDIAV
jgi:pSer/pThr/pTyr-binding forkhead associated (FHA) protein/S1-C subfamily serine protease